MLFLCSPLHLVDRRVEVVVPAFTALLASPAVNLVLTDDGIGDQRPALCAVLVDECSDCIVLIFSPDTAGVKKVSGRRLRVVCEHVLKKRRDEKGGAKVFMVCVGNTTMLIAHLTSVNSTVSPADLGMPRTRPVWGISRSLRAGGLPASRRARRRESDAAGGTMPPRQIDCG